MSNEQVPSGPGFTRLLEAVVTSADADAAVAFYRDVFGFETVADDEAGELLAAAGSTGGRIRVLTVEADRTLPAEPPAVWDLGPRLLGIYSRDLARTEAQAIEAGAHTLAPVTYGYGSAQMSEMVLRGPDGLWWTVPLVPEPPMTPQPSPALRDDAERTHSELHSAVLVVADHDAAVRFFVDGGMSVVFDGEMTGPDFERLVGMPEGAALRLAFLVGPEKAPGRIEIMSFTGVDAVDRSGDPVGVRRLQDRHPGRARHRRADARGRCRGALGDPAARARRRADRARAGPR